jgi:hypothetical protein
MLSLRYRWSDLHDFGIQSSQIGPHLVQPFISSPKAITLTINPNRRNIVHHSRVFDHTAPGPSFSSQRRCQPETRETFRHLGAVRSAMPCFVATQ